MITALVVIVIVLFVWGSTRKKDAELQAAGEPTPAPEWARWLFVLIVGGALMACVGIPFISGLGG